MPSSSLDPRDFATDTRTGRGSSTILARRSLDCLREIPKGSGACRPAGCAPASRYGLACDPSLYLRTSDWLAAHRRAASEEYDLAVFRNDRETNLPYPQAWRVLSSIVPTRFHRRLIRALSWPVRRRKARIAGTGRGGHGIAPGLQGRRSRASGDLRCDRAWGARRSTRIGCTRCCSPPCWARKCSRTPRRIRSSRASTNTL